MYFFLKRLFDILASFVLITLLLPFMLPIIIALLFTAERKVFYKQERVGFKNKVFYIWKFATMLKDSPKLGTGDITLRNDPRVTRIGKFLRKTKINELPQLINVLKGDMSFVGPRPLMPRGFADFPEEMKNQVYNVVPGLTGAGSIIFRDEELVLTQSSLTPRETYKHIIQPYKGELELWYQRNVSFKTDFLLLFLTFWQIIRPGSKLVYKIFPDLPLFKTALVRD